MKICKVCGKKKPLTDFYKRADHPGYQYRCKQCFLEYSKERRKNFTEEQHEHRRMLERKACKTEAYKERKKRWIKDNPEKRREIQKRYYEKYPERVIETRRKGLAAKLIKNELWRKNNPESGRAARRRQHEKRKNDPDYKLNSGIRENIRASLVGKKNGRKWEALVGYTLDDLMQHLESRFSIGMTWDNYGLRGWHVDHVIPIAYFNFTSSEDPGFKKCWALENLQPLWAKKNWSKGARYADSVQSI